MGQRGPSSKPKEVLRLRGSHEEYRNGRGNEPDLQTGEPIPPDWLDGRALAHWPIACEWMRNMQTLSPAWSDAIAGYCEAFGEYEDLVIECKGQPKVVYGKSGAPYLNPLYGAKAKAWDRVLKVARELGLTPAAKASVRVEDTPQKSGKERYFA